jgi:hypothetical protein
MLIEYNSTEDLPIEDYYDEGGDNDNNNRDDPEGYVVGISDSKATPELWHPFTHVSFRCKSYWKGRWI